MRLQRQRAKKWSVVFAVAAIDAGWLTTAPEQKLAIGFESTNYIFEKAELPMQGFQSIQAQLALRNQSDSVRLGVRAQGLYTVGASLPFNFDVNEIYIGTARLLPVGELTLGRKLKAWSELDDAWKMGVWQPRFFFDPIWANPSGLIGLFYDVQTLTPMGELSLTFMGSGLSFPEQGLLTAFQDGRVVSPSRWMRAVPASLPMMGSNVAVNYRLAMPGMDQILIQPSVMGRARLGGARGFWGALAYGYKPIEQILMTMDGALDINSAMQVQLAPRIGHHHVATLEAGYNSEKWSATLSALGEIPVIPPAAPQLTWQNLQPSLAAGPLIRFSPQGVGRAPRILAGYLLQTGGDAPDQGPLADPNQTAFDRRYFFQNALLLDGETDIATEFFRPFFGAELIGRLRSVVDLAYGSILLSPQLSVRVKDTVSIGLGADVFATTARNYAQAGFLGQSVQNTRVYARLGIGF